MTDTKQGINAAAWFARQSFHNRYESLSDAALDAAPARPLTMTVDRWNGTSWDAVTLTWNGTQYAEAK